MEKFEFRQATPEDVPLLASLEARCFPPAEGASLERIRDRVNEYADRFLIMLQNGNIVGMVNGLCTDNKDLVIAQLFAQCSSDIRLDGSDDHWLSYPHPLKGQHRDGSRAQKTLAS